MLKCVYCGVLCSTVYQYSVGDAVFAKIDSGEWREKPKRLTWMTEPAETVQLNGEISRPPNTAEISKKRAGTIARSG